MHPLITQDGPGRAARVVVKTEVRGDDSTMVRLEVTNTPSPDDPAVNVWEVRDI